MKLPVLLLVAACAFLAACGGNDDKPRDATPSPEATTAAGPMPSPGSAPALQALGLQTQAVKWVDADVFEKTITEIPDPFKDSRFVGVPPNVPPSWSLHASLEGGPARPLYETKRWIQESRWDQDGLSVRFLTRRAVTIAGSGEKADVNWMGTLRFDPSTGHVREELDPLPFTTQPDIGGAGSQPTGRTIVVDVDLAKSQALISIGTGSGPYRRIDAVYILDKQGKSKKLQGMPDLRSVSFLPSGAALTGYAAPLPVGQFVPSNDNYIIPTSDGQAIHTGEAPFGAEGWNSYEAVKGSRAALLVKDPNGTTLGASLILLYDTRTRDLRVLGKGPPVLRPNPAGFPMQVPVLWPDGSNEFILMTGMDGVIVDAMTGATRPGRQDEVVKPLESPENRSPNGRYTAAVEWGDVQATPAQDCSGKPARLVVTDTQTGNKRTVFECPGGTPGQVTWIDDNKLVVNFSKGFTRLTLVDIISGRMVPLTGEMEPIGGIKVSPDKTRLLVTGASLRVLDANGTQLRDLGPAPADLHFLFPVWSADGKSFAWVLSSQSW